MSVNETAVAVQESRAPAQAVEVLPSLGDYSVYIDTHQFEMIQRAAMLLSKARMVPEHYRNSPSDCFIAVQMAMRLKMDPFLVMQHTYIVHGRFGIEGKFVSALINRSGLYQNALEYVFEHDEKTKAVKSCTAFAVRKSTGRHHEVTLTMETVIAEGWLGKAGSKWKTMAEQMFVYRSAAFFARRWCPEVLMGLETVDELRDVGAPRQAEPTNERVLELNSLLGVGDARVNTETGELAPAETSEQRDDMDTALDATFGPKKGANGKPSHYLKDQPGFQPKA